MKEVRTTRFYLIVKKECKRFLTTIIVEEKLKLPEQTKEATMIKKVSKKLFKKRINKLHFFLQRKNRSKFLDK